MTNDEQYRIVVASDLHISDTHPTDEELEWLVEQTRRPDYMFGTNIFVCNGDLLDRYRNSIDSETARRTARFLRDMRSKHCDQVILNEGTASHDGRQLGFFASMCGGVIHIQHTDLYQIGPGIPAVFIVDREHPDNMPLDVLEKQKAHITCFHCFTDKDRFTNQHRTISTDLLSKIADVSIGGHVHTGYSVGSVHMLGIFSPRNFKDDGEPNSRIAIIEGVIGEGVTDIKLVDNPLAKKFFKFRLSTDEKKANEEVGSNLQNVERLLKANPKLHFRVVAEAPTSGSHYMSKAAERLKVKYGERFEFVPVPTEAVSDSDSANLSFAEISPGEFTAEAMSLRLNRTISSLEIEEFVKNNSQV